MESEVTLISDQLLPEEQDVIVHDTVNEVSNSQNPEDKENTSKPFIFQAGPSKDSSEPSKPFTFQAGPSKDLSEPVPGPSFTHKRRGRPSREDYLKFQRTRESQRAKKVPKALNYESFKSPNLSWQWSDRDKDLFIAGIREVGIEDISGLKQFLPHKTDYDIKSQIAMWTDVSSKNLEKFTKEEAGSNDLAKKIKNLDEWIDYFSEITNKSKISPFPISNYFALIAEYGDFPSPEECGGIDARAMYRYLHCMMNGLPLNGLNQVTAKALLSCIDNFLEQFDDPNLIERMEEHLFNIPDVSEEYERKFGKTYSRKKENTSSKFIDQIQADPVMNPLTLPVKALIHEPPEESSDED